MRRAAICLGGALSLGALGIWVVGAGPAGPSADAPPPWEDPDRPAAEADVVDGAMVVAGHPPGGDRGGRRSGPQPRRASPGAPDASRASAAQEAEGPAYDGRFTFLRLRFEAGAGRMRGFFGGGGQAPWAHDAPRAERNFARILEATTTADPYMDGGRVLELTDPELFKYPIAYIVEVGYWRPDEEAVRALREYLLKGGFLIVDDFRGRDIRNFRAQMARVLPGVEMRPVEADHRIFDSFFHIEDPDAFLPPTFRQFPPIYLGMYEDDDPSKRLLAVINYNNDIAEYWEYSDMGFYPIDLANDAYKFGVNYVIYGMTH